MSFKESFIIHTLQIKALILEKANRLPKDMVSECRSGHWNPVLFGSCSSNFPTMSSIIS